MKVQELIEELQKLDPKLWVIFGTRNRGYLDVERLDGPFHIDTDDNCDWLKDSILLTTNDERFHEI
jgi:hypothetical protein